MPETLFVPDDGYTLPGKVPRFPGLYPEVRFKYRPATPAVRAEYSNAAARDKEEAADKLISRQVTELRVVSAEHPDGGPPVRLAPETVRRLHAELHQGILYHVIGLAGPDLEELEKNSPSASGSNSSPPGSPPAVAPTA